MNNPREHFDYLYKKHYNSVVGYFYKRLDENDAEDSAQLVFMKLWAYLPNYPSIRNERALIFRIAKGVLSDTLRAKKLSESIDLHTDIPSPGQIYESVELQEKINALSPRDREIVSLKGAGFSSGEIAKIQGCKPSTIRSRMQTIREKLKD